MNTSRNKDRWDSLSMKEKSDMMKVAVQQGIYNLSDIRKAYNEYAEGGPEETNEEKTQWFNDWYSGRSQQLADNYRNYGINGQSSIGDAFMYLLPNRYTNDYFAKRAKESILNNVKTVDEGYLPTTKGQGTLTDAQYKLAQKILNQSVSDINSDDSDDVYLLNVLQKGAYYPKQHTILYSPYADESDKIHERTHAAKAQFIKNAIRSNQPKLQDGVTSDRYLDNPSEIYSRLNSFRFENKLTPTDIIDRKKLEDFKKYAKDYDLLDRYDDDSLLFLLNDVAYNSSNQSQEGYNITALGGPLINLANHYAEGGPTDKDNSIVDWIINEEGFNSRPENIGDGKITLGSGLTNSKWHKIYNKKGTWTAEDNRAAVAEEVENRRRWAEQNVPNWGELPADSQNALLSYKYNYNFTPKNSPKLFKALEDRNYEEAARQMDATSSNPRFRKGLQARRQREQEMFMRGIDSMNAPEPEVVEEIPQEESIYTPPQRVLDNMAAHNGKYMIMGNPPFAGVRNTVLDALRRLKALNLFIEGGPLVDLANRTK